MNLTPKQTARSHAPASAARAYDLAELYASLLERLAQEMDAANPCNPVHVTALATTRVECARAAEKLGDAIPDGLCEGGDAYRQWAALSDGPSPVQTHAIRKWASAWRAWVRLDDLRRLAAGLLERLAREQRAVEQASRGFGFAIPQHLAALATTRGEAVRACGLLYEQIPVPDPYGKICEDAIEALCSARPIDSATLDAWAKSLRRAS